MIEGEEPLDADAETRHAIVGYRDAMTYVLQLATDPPPVDASLVRSLHFMMMKYDLAKNPGRWRPGAIWVEDHGGRVVYEAPDVDQVEDLMSETMAWVNADDGPVMVRAAMAHLNVTLIHPFSDGNGRMARCLQTLALASAGPVSPEFCSVEEYLGHDTKGYYTSSARWPREPGLPSGTWRRGCGSA